MHLICHWYLQFGATLLEAAVWSGDADMVKVLVEAGADVKAETKVCERTFILAVSHCPLFTCVCKRTCMHLICHWYLQFGETLLEAAVRSGNADMVKVLVEAGADVNAEAEVCERSS